MIIAQISHWWADKRCCLAMKDRNSAVAMEDVVCGVKQAGPARLSFRKHREILRTLRETGEPTQ
jgi:hypothetical protein